MATDDDSDVPETGAVFTFGKSKFADNAPSKFWIREDKVLHISCGDEHTSLLAESGRVFTFGDNAWGQLGLGHTKPVTKPTRIKSLKAEKVHQVACGRSHTLLATESGKIYSFGCNNDRQLGLGLDDEKVCSPTVIKGLESHAVRMLSAGMYHSCVLTDKGSVYLWGGGEEGQLGFGEDVTKHETPERLDVDDEVVCIACGYYHTALVTAGGKLLTFGETDEGKLGRGSDTGDNCLPKVVDGIEGHVVSVACGGAHTVAITDDGRVYTFGNGSSGQLGHGNMLLQADTPHKIVWQKPTKVRSASCGENHTALVTDRGQLWTCGDGRHGKLALGEENFANQFKPCHSVRFSKFVVEQVSCGGCHTLATGKPSLQNGNAAHDSSDEEGGLDFENGDLQKPHSALTQAVINRAGDFSGSFDLSGSISARNRRREKLPEAAGSLNRTLPPLNSSFLGAAPFGRPLAPLESSLSASTANNPLNLNRIPLIKKEQEAGLSKSMEDSGHSEGSGSEDEEDMAKKRAMIKQESAAIAQRSAPLPKPRALPSREKPVPVARKQPEKKEETDSDAEKEESDSTSEDEEKKPKLTKKEEVKRKKEEEKKRKVEEKKKKEEEKKQKEEEKKRKDEEKKKEKDKRKKTGGLFGKKKVIESEEETEDSESDSDEEEEEEEEEEVKKKPKKSVKKGKKSKKVESSEEETEDEESAEDAKEKSKAKKTKKSKEEKSKDKKKKSSKTDESEEGEDKNKDDEATPSTSKEQPAKKEEKKSRLCTVL